MKNIANKMLNKHSDELRKIGLLFYILNQVENKLNMVIQIFFSEFNQLKGLIFNQALLDEKIFPSLENKRKFLLKMIQIISEEAKKRNMNFDEKKWKKVCKSISELQVIRNKLAHKFLSFPEKNTAAYILRKKYDRILEEEKQGRGHESFETKRIDLDEEIKKAEQILFDNEKLITDFLPQAWRIVDVNIPNAQ